MSTIYQETFTAGTDKALVLANEEAGRLMEIGSTWTRIRVGLLMAIETDGTTNNISNAQFRVGLSSAAADHAGSQSATHWCGWVGYHSGVASYTGGTFTYNAGAGSPYYTYATKAIWYIRAGTATNVAQTNGSWGFAAASGVARRFPMFLEFYKVTTSLWVTSVHWNDGTNTNKDYTLTDVVTSMEDPTELSVGGAGGGSLSCGGSTFSCTTAAITGYTAAATANGEVKAIQIGFSKATFPLRIYSVVIARYA